MTFALKPQNNNEICKNERNQMFFWKNKLWLMYKLNLILNISTWCQLAVWSKSESGLAVMLSGCYLYYSYSRIIDNQLINSLEEVF